MATVIFYCVGMLKQTHATYRAFLVRLWRNDQSAEWRILAKDVQSGQTYHFSTAEACVRFLQQHDATENADFPNPQQSNDKTQRNSQ